MADPDAAQADGYWHTPALQHGIESCTACPHRYRTHRVGALRRPGKRRGKRATAQWPSFPRGIMSCPSADWNRKTTPCSRSEQDQFGNGISGLTQEVSPDVDQD